MTWSDFLRILGITDNPRIFEPQRKNVTKKWVNRKYDYIIYLSFIELFKTTLKIFLKYILFAFCLRFFIHCFSVM